MDILVHGRLDVIHISYDLIDNSFLVGENTAVDGFKLHFHVLINFGSYIVT